MTLDMVEGVSRDSEVHVNPRFKRMAQQDKQEDMFEFSKHWAYALIGTAVAFVALLTVAVYVIIKRRRKASSPLTPEPPKQTSLQCPPITISIQPTHQQPSLDDIIRSTPQPIRIKARGLLERCNNTHVPNQDAAIIQQRGSNASLTIDLNQQDSSFQCGTPPKECSAEEYLTSAGNRMTRKQLRACIKNIKCLEQEFLDIPLNHPGKLDFPGCSNKNRYRSIWPNECTRVTLPERNGDPSTTYINANYVKGYDGEDKAFIATQGPLVNTISDFWEMIWQESCPCIVMMTKLREKHKIKCESYLPNREGTYGQIHVAVRSVINKNGYYIRELLLQRENETRQLKHFWFTGWPDHKAPISTGRQLIELALDVERERQRRKHSKHHHAMHGPVTVHCSAGIGRTGCFIGTSIGMQQLAEENMIDMLGIVCQMRLDRGGMIQTPEQYEFLHHAIALYESELPETPTSAPLPLTSSSNGSSANASPTY